MRNIWYSSQDGSVALRKESVDRNLLRDCRDSIFERVALRKESVDRNCWRSRNRHPNIPVALRKESVDRNQKLGQ